MAEQNHDINIRVKEEGADEATRKIRELDSAAEKAGGNRGGVGTLVDKVTDLGSELKGVASGDIPSAVSSIRSLTGVMSGATAVAGGFALAAVAVVAAVEGIGAEMAAAADDASEFADKLGVTTSRLEALKLIADENSGSVEGLQKVYDKLSKSMTKFDEDNEKTQKAFEQLGITAEEVGRMTEQQLAGRIIKAYDDLGRSAQSTAAVQQLLGGAFREQIPSIKAAADEFDQYLERVREFGSEASPALVAAGGEQEKALNNLSLAWKGLKNQIAEYSTGIVTDVANWAASVLKSIRDVMKEFREGRSATSAALTAVTAVSPERRQELVKQARNDVYNGSNPNATEGDVNARLKQLISQEMQQNFRRGEIEAMNAGTPGVPATVVNPPKPPETPETPETPGKPGKPRKVFDVEANRGAALRDILRAAEQESKIAEKQLEQFAKAAEERQKVLDNQTEIARRGAARVSGIGASATAAVSFDERTRGMSSFEKDATAQIDEVRAARVRAEEELDKDAANYDENMKKIAAAEQAATAAVLEATQKRKEASMDWTNGAKDAFASYLDSVQDVAGKTAELFDGAFQKAEDALVNFAMTGKLEVKSLVSSILADLARYLIQTQVMAPIIAGLKALIGFSAGGVFSGGNVIPFANGGVVSSPTLFPMTGGKTGMMGEAGPEDIMPLRRGPDGKLGVASAGGGGGVSVGTIQVIVQGGATNEKTGDVVTAAVVRAMEKVADARIRRATTNGGILNPI